MSNKRKERTDPGFGLGNMGATEHNSKVAASTRAATAAVQEQRFAIDTGESIDYTVMSNRALGKEEPSAKKRLMVIRFHQWLTAEINQSAHLIGAEAAFWHAAKLYLADIGRPYPFDMTCGMANKLIWEREFANLMTILALADELQPHSEYILDRPTFEQVQAASRKLLSEAACQKSQERVREEVQRMQGAASPEAVNGMQDKDDVLPPYGFTRQKQRVLDRRDQMFEACQCAVENPDNPDAQNVPDNCSIVRIGSEVYLHSDQVKNDLHVGTGTVFDCTRWAIQQFVNKARFTPKKKQAESAWFTLLYKKQTADLVAASDKVIRHPHDASLRHFLPLGCQITEEERGLFLRHPVVENGVQIATRPHASASWMKTINEEEIHELVISIRDRNDEKRAEQSRVERQATAKAGVPAA